MPRARRDPAGARPLRRLDDTWHDYLTALLRRGVAAGVFHTDLDPGRAARTLMVQIKGLIVQPLGEADPAQIDALVAEIMAQVERGLRR